MPDLWPTDMLNIAPAALSHQAMQVTRETILTADGDATLFAIAAAGRDATTLYYPADRTLVPGLSGGTAFNYMGTIVPENPLPGQVTEAQFLADVADTLSAQLPAQAIGGEVDEQWRAAMRLIVAAIFRAIVPETVRLELVLRRAFGVSTDLSSTLSVSDLEARVIGAMPQPQDLSAMLSLGAPIDAAHSEAGAKEAARVMLAGAALLWWPKLGGKVLAFEPWQWFMRVGNEVHGVIQAHYWLTHPHDLMMFEDFIVAGPAFLATVYDAVKGDFEPAFAFLRDLAQALMVEGKGLAKRPDILNITQQHLYEIKTINEAKSPETLKQVNDYMTRLTPVLTDLRLAGMASGDWKPYPLYYCGGTTLAMVEVVAPGIIAYQRLGTRLPVLRTLRAWSDQKQYLQRTRAEEDEAAALGTAVGVATVTILFCAALLVFAPLAVVAGAAILEGAADLTIATTAARVATAAGLATGVP